MPRYFRRHYQHDADRVEHDPGHFHTRRHNGWGMGLYRNSQNGVLAGVAAGLADHWDVATWVVRLLWVVAFLFTGSLALWGYVACWFCLARRPDRAGMDDLDYQAMGVEMEYDERRHNYRPRKVFNYPESHGVRLDRARERLDAALRRVESVESYVTSRQYALNKEFSKLEAGERP